MKIFAWDGMEFPIPLDWDLANYSVRRHIASLIFEDATDVRMQIDWTPSTGRSQAALVQRQHAQFSEQLHESALSIETVDDISERWVVFLYAMPESVRLMTALHVAEQMPLFVLIRFHALQCSRREIIRDARAVIQGFRHNSEGPVAWRLFDYAWRVPRRFRLIETSLLAGRKMMVFDQRMRRLFVWRLSLADRLLREKTPSEVAAEFINKSKCLPGVRFIAGDDGHGRLSARRKILHPFGHYEEIGRACFRYWTQVGFSEADNAMTIAVFNYRRASDLIWLDGLDLSYAGSTDT